MTIIKAKSHRLGAADQCQLPETCSARNEGSDLMLTDSHDTQKHSDEIGLSKREGGV